MHRVGGRRHLVQDRHVKVSVNGHSSRPGDGRGCHNQHVGNRAVVILLSKSSPLFDTEPVLLIDDHHAERPKPDPLLDQRMGADEHVDAAGHQLCANSPTLSRGGAVG